MSQKSSENYSQSLGSQESYSSQGLTLNDSYESSFIDDSSLSQSGFSSQELF